MLPYIAAFLTWQAATLLGLVVVVYCIVRRKAAIAIVLASPFAAWNFLIGQNGFLTAALLGASLLALERHPALAGVFIGCLTCKPQFGILFPVALVAAKQWRAICSAAATTAVLAAISIAVFGAGPWAAFLGELAAQADINLLGSADKHWGLLQAIYGLARDMGGGSVVAWALQGVTTFGAAVIVWLIWRSRVRYPLKAATMAAAALIATPYALAYDMAAVAVPVAFLAKDQIRCGLLRAEQTTLLALFAASLPAFLSAGRAPLCALISLTLLGLILRRGVTDEKATAFVAAPTLQT